MLGAAVVVYLVVIGTLIGAAVRAPRSREAMAARSTTRWVAAVAGSTMCVVAAVLAYTLRVVDLLRDPVTTSMTIAITGHQWWWEAVYDDADPNNRFTTANEIHVPVGQPVAIALRSADVIHSFWVPSLAGKRDLTPGHPSRLLIQADTPGVYRGQCSQFCGLQHAHMALVVVADAPERFAEWASEQRRAANAPSAADSLRARGKTVFVAARCGTCHTIDGVISLAAFGPNLTHLASRATIAAATLTNTPEHLAAWVRDPQSAKRGATMPPNPLNAADLEALVAYLGALK